MEVGEACGVREGGGGGCCWEVLTLYSMVLLHYTAPLLEKLDPSLYSIFKSRGIQNTRAGALAGVESPMDPEGKKNVLIQPIWFKLKKFNKP